MRLSAAVSACRTDNLMINPRGRGWGRSRREEAAEDGTGAGDGDLLADDGAYRHLEAVGGARQAYPGLLGDRGGERAWRGGRGSGEGGVDGDGVGVEVEQAAASVGARLASQKARSRIEAIAAVRLR
jgi:hypothetical protein